MRRLLISSLAIVGLTACIGPGNQQCDSVTNIGCVDDSDPIGGGGGGGGGGTDDPFDPWLFTVEIHAGYDGTELTSYGIQGTEQEAYVVFQFYEEEYRTQQLDEFTCTWTGRIISQTPSVLDDRDSAAGVSNLWAGWDVQFEWLPSATLNTCEGWDEDYWTDGQPTEAIEGMDFGFGYAPISLGLRNDLEESYTNAGYNWAEYEPYVLGVHWRVKETGWGYRTEEMGYGYSTWLDEDGNLVFREDGEYEQAEVIDATEAPYPAYYATWYAYGYDAWAVLGP